MTNFKGEKQRTTKFNADVTTISGGNGLGKSRHFNAFIWLLFGKDSQDRKDYEVKTRINGEEFHKVECSVTGVLDCDGEEITIKRSLAEDWVKPRGQAEPVYKGNHTECWWNETPVSVSEYDRRIQSIINIDIFKMITNPEFFVAMNWKLQREQLFQLAGTITDAEIASQKPEFALLLDKISGKSLADFKAEVSAKKKRLKSELDQIQPRIDQTHKMKPENEDFATLEVRINDIDKEIADIDESLSSVTAAIRKSAEAEQARQNRINALKKEQLQIIFNAEAEAEKTAFEANAEKRELESETKSKRRELELKQRELASAQQEKKRLADEIVKISAIQDDLRKKWHEENYRQYDGSTDCPHCGQRLPDEMILKATELFANAKIEKLEEINEKGKRLGDNIEGLKDLINKANKDIEIIGDDINTLKIEIEKAEVALSATPTVTASEIIPENIPEWVARQKEITYIEATVATDNSNCDTTDLQTRKKALLQELTEAINRLKNRDIISRCDKEIADLEENGRKLAQQIADLEKEEYTVQQFTVTKINECSKRINSMFKFVTFRLFDYTLDGNPVETCIPLVDGVPYGSANTAGQFNAGLDIINTLCRHYGICAPIFIDKRESVNEIIPTESQIINLVVTQDKVLTVK